MGVKNGPNQRIKIKHYVTAAHRELYQSNNFGNQKFNTAARMLSGIRMLSSTKKVPS